MPGGAFAEARWERLPAKFGVESLVYGLDKFDQTSVEGSFKNAINAMLSPGKSVPSLSREGIVSPHFSLKTSRVPVELVEI